MNNVVLIGRLARDPELRFIPSTGMGVAKFPLAVDRELSKDKKAEAVAKGQSTADFIQVTVFGKLAENCANFLAKGRECAVIGRIQTGSYVTQDGVKKYSFDVIANRVEFIGGKNEGNGPAPANNKPQTQVAPVEDEDNIDNSFFENLNGDDLFDDEDIPF